MIKHISFTNVKGKSGEVAFTPITILTGENHAGKTAVLDALAIAIRGHHPRLGKTNPATWRLSSGTTMAVAIAGENWTLSREWKESGKSIKATEARSVATPELNAASLSLDPEAFVSAPPKARLSLLASLAGAGSDYDTRIAGWKAKLQCRPKAEDPIGQMEELEEAARQQAANLREVARRYVGTVQGGAELGEDPVPMDAGALTAAIAASESALTVLNAATATAAACERAADAAADAREELQTMTIVDHEDPANLLAAMERTMSERVTAEMTSRHINEKLEALWTKMKCEEADFPGIIATLNETILEIQKLEPVDVNSLTIDKMRATDQANQAGGRASLDRSGIEAIEKSIATIDEAPHCPTCKACSPGWRDEVVADHRRRIALLKESEQNNEADAKIQYGKAAELASLIERGKQTNATIALLPDLIERAAAAETYREELAKLPEAEATTAMQAYEAALAAEKAAAEAYKANEAKLDAMQRQNALQAIVLAAPAAIDVTAALQAQQTAEDAYNEARAEVIAMQERQRASAAAAGQRALINKAKEELEKAEQEAEVSAALQKAIRSAREEAVQNGYRPIISLAGFFGTGIIEGTLAVLDGEIGLSRGPTFVPMELMSGTERVVVTASIQAALSKGGLVIVDELSRMTRKNRRRFCENLMKGINQGLIEQAIFVDPDAECWAGSFVPQISVVKI